MPLATAQNSMVELEVHRPSSGTEPQPVTHAVLEVSQACPAGQQAEPHTREAGQHWLFTQASPRAQHVAAHCCAAGQAFWHRLLVHNCPAPHAVQAVPPPPHAAVAAPVWQTPAWQHPAQFDGPHTTAWQVPFTHCCPLGQVPVGLPALHPDPPLQTWPMHFAPSTHATQMAPPVPQTLFRLPSWQPP